MGACVVAKLFELVLCAKCATMSPNTSIANISSEKCTSRNRDPMTFGTGA